MTTDPTPPGPTPSGPIGVFDSGVGGLSVWREIARQLPHEDTLYFADQQHVPYGPRTQEQIRVFCESIARFLLGRGCKAIVVACNTASAAALKHLREAFPDHPVIGMEPAVKPAAAATKTGVVGVMATPTTFQGRLFQATAGRHAANIRLINQVCDGLAELVESGELDGARAEQMLRGFLAPMLDANADTIVLACTHYPFVIEPIRRIAGEAVTVIDPAPAIARHLGDVLDDKGLAAHRGRTGEHLFYTSGEVAVFAALAARLVAARASVREARWQPGLVLAESSASA